MRKLISGVPIMGRNNYEDASAAHPAIIRARDELLTPESRTKHRITHVVSCMIRRTAWLIAERYAGVHPNALGGDFYKAERAWVREQRFSRAIAGPSGGRLLFDKLAELGLRDPALPNPFATGYDEWRIGSTRGPRKRTRPPLPACPEHMPARLRPARQHLFTYLQRQVDLRDQTEGHQGLSRDWCEMILQAFDDLVAYMQRRNERVSPKERWALTLNAIYSDPEIIAEFLWSGEAKREVRGGSASNATRVSRKRCLLRAYDLFRFRKLAPDHFREKLDDFLKQGGARPELGGATEQIVESLSTRERAAVRALLADEIEKADQRWARMRGTFDQELSWRLRCRAYRRNAIFEFAIGTGIREQGIASAELQSVRRTERGSIIVDAVRYKRHPGGKRQEETYYRPQWVPPDGWEAVRRYLEVLGVRDPLRKRTEWELRDPEHPLGRPVHIKRGQLYAGTVQAEARDHFPIFRTETDAELSPSQVGTVLRALLRQANISTQRPQAMRHSACDEAINEWHVSPAEAARVFGWTTVQLVLERYARAPIEQIYEKFDSLSQRKFIADGASVSVTREVIAALHAFLAEMVTTPEANLLTMTWPALVRALDQLSDLDPSAIRPSEGVVLTLQEWAKLDHFVRTRTDRHSDAARVIGRDVEPGLAVPEPPEDAEGDPDSDKVA